jgi:hypothetical protein
LKAGAAGGLGRIELFDAGETAVDEAVWVSARQ